MTDPFEPDCDACAGLCCIAHSFDEGDSFAFDKDAGVPCKHLARGARCAIHGALESHGFPGCVTYTCLGAGQIVVQDLYDGQSWQDDEELTGPMLDDFTLMKQVQDLRSQLAAAAELDLDEDQEDLRAELEAELAPGHWTRETLDALDLPAFRTRFRAFLSDLRATMTGGE